MKAWTVLLWLSFLSCLCAIFYLSFQNGEEAKELGTSIMLKTASIYYNRDKFTDGEVVDIIYRFRQYGRMVAFTVLGVLGTATIHTTFYKWLWIIRAVVSTAMLLFIAVFTEKYKMFLPTRHYSEEEMMYSIYAVLLGFAFVSVVTLVYSLIKWLLKNI